MIIQNVIFLIFSYPSFDEIILKFLKSGFFYVGLYSFLTLLKILRKIISMDDSKVPFLKLVR